MYVPEWHSCHMSRQSWTVIESPWSCEMADCFVELLSLLGIFSGRLCFLPVQIRHYQMPPTSNFIFLFSLFSWLWAFKVLAILRARSCSLRLYRLLRMLPSLRVCCNACWSPWRWGTSSECSHPANVLCQAAEQISEIPFTAPSGPSALSPLIDLQAFKKAI